MNKVRIALSVALLLLVIAAMTPFGISYTLADPTQGVEADGQLPEEETGEGEIESPEETATEGGDGTEADENGEGNGDGEDGGDGNGGGESGSVGAEALCICCFDEHGDGHTHGHEEWCLLYQAPEHSCEAEMDENNEIFPLESGPLDDGPQCDCGHPGGPHGEGCPLYQEPIYMDVTDLIDALPGLDEVRRMDLGEVYGVQQLIFEIRDMITERVSGFTEAEDFERFDAELGETRIEKYNSIFQYVDEYIKTYGMRARGSLAGATSINIALGRFYVTATSTPQYARQYNANTATVLAYYPYNADGYRIYGSNTVNYASNPKIQVSPGVTNADLFFDNLVITNNSCDCVNVTGADVTITLVDGTVNNLTCGWGSTGSTGGGALVKNNAVDGKRLTIRCEHSDEPGHLCDPGICGALNARGGTTYHVAAIGSAMTSGVGSNVGGFANLYIEGGIITAQAGQHTPGIGSQCGTSYMRSGAVNVTNPQMLNGQICKNINITGGRVYAYGGEGCSGIGSGWGVPVDGIYISGGAYVYAEGGLDSPGIGSGGNEKASPRVPGTLGRYDVSNIEISGGITVVEAVGGTSNYSGKPYTPGIGCGFSYLGDTGTLTNVQAQPEADWLAVVKQGTNINDATYIAGTPSPHNTDIIANMYYTLVYFSELQKTASVNGGAEETGEPEDMVQISAGDRVTYTLTPAAGIDPNALYDLVDEVPEGMTLVTTAGSYSPGMTWGTTGGVTTVKWLNQMGPQTFLFNVIVDSLGSELEMDYINQAVMTTESTTLSALSVPSNFTYHHADNPYAYIQVKKLIGNYSGLNTATQAELAERPFIIALTEGTSNKAGAATLGHGQTSGSMLLTFDTHTTSLTVTETVPMEFSENYAVTAFITHKDGATSTQNGRTISLQSGDDVLITVTNTFEPKPYFKGWTWLSNIFQNGAGS
ncbi:MAG: hypothetical protein FWG03_02250 [Clostridiales bacterium]|nr:hypothetical protein [Clostridiales bacterium]